MSGFVNSDMVDYNGKRAAMGVLKKHHGKETQKPSPSTSS
jgi:hypothetical protein